MSRHEEIKFIHDLANPLAVAQGNAMLAFRRLEQLQTQGEAPSVVEFKERIQKILNACDKLVHLLSEHRQSLVDHSDELDDSFRKNSGDRDG